MMEPAPKQLADLARTLANTRPEELDCDAVLARIAAFAEAMRDGAVLTAEWSAVRQHLDVCPECLEEFDALVASME